MASSAMPADSIDPTRVQRPDGSQRLFIFARFVQEAATGPAVEWEGLIAINPKTGAWQKFSEHGFEARVAPDGKKLALNRMNDHALYLCNSADGDSLRPIKNLGQSFHVVGWSPDGGEILVLMEKKATSSVLEHWRLKADGSGAVTWKLPEGHVVLDWSRVENLLLTFRRSPATGGQVYVMRPDGTVERQLTKEGDNAVARFSPDGKRVAYLHRQDTQAGRSVDVWMVDRDGKNNRPVFASRTTKTLQLCWSPDGSALALIILDLKKGVPLEELNFRPVLVDLQGKVIRAFQLPRRDLLLLRDWTS